MSHQSEQQLEKTFMNRLNRLGFSSVIIEDSGSLLNNLRMQLERFNKIVFSDKEFKKVLNHLNKGNRF